MEDESTECPEHSDATETDRYARWLEGALYWLHYEKAEIHTLSKREVNQLAREELARRKSDMALEATPRRVYAWLFIEYTLYRDEEPAYRRGESDD